MSRRQKRKFIAVNPIGWVLSYSDLVTLLLTFFVCLISMASLKDERRQLTTLAAVSGNFGGVPNFLNFVAQEDSSTGNIQGAKGLEQLRPLFLEDKQGDVHYLSNPFVQVLSIRSRLLFEPGQSILKPEGRAYLIRLLPLLKKVEYPFLLCSHTAIARDEYGLSLAATQERSGIDPTWSLSLNRISTVYQFFLSQGISPSAMRVEAFGQFAPRYSSNTPAGREGNRRLDIILDKRSPSLTKEELANRPPRPEDQPRLFKYKDFTFDLQ